MAACCTGPTPESYEGVFNDRYAQQLALQYRRRGLTPPAQRIVEFIASQGIDLAMTPDALATFDVVVLHRVVCCYPDADRLLSAAASHARHTVVPDEQTEPTTYGIITLSRPELLELRQVTGDIRRATFAPLNRPTSDSMTKSSQSVIMNCSLTAPPYGIDPSPAVPIFAEHKITLQQTRHASLTFNAAFTAILETHRENDDRSWLAEPNPPANKPSDILMLLIRTWISADRWRHEPDLRRLISNSRLNLARGIGKKTQDPHIRSAHERYVAYVPRAIENSRRLANF